MTFVNHPAVRLEPRCSVVVTSVASDSHSWNLVFLQLVLEELGCRVTNLGPCAPDELIVAQCRTHRPDLLAVSSVNGHGYRDGLRIIDRLKAQPELTGLPVVIGGKLGIGADGASAQVDRLLAAGFTDVFADGRDGHGRNEHGDNELDRFRSFVRSLPVGAVRSTTAGAPR